MDAAPDRSGTVDLVVFETEDGDETQDAWRLARLSGSLEMIDVGPDFEHWIDIARDGTGELHVVEFPDEASPRVYDLDAGAPGPQVACDALVDEMGAGPACVVYGRELVVTPLETLVPQRFPAFGLSTWMLGGTPPLLNTTPGSSDQTRFAEISTDGSILRQADFTTKNGCIWGSSSSGARTEGGTLFVALLEETHQPECREDCSRWHFALLDPQ